MRFFAGMRAVFRGRIGACARVRRHPVLPELRRGPIGAPFSASKRATVDYLSQNAGCGGESENVHRRESENRPMPQGRRFFLAETDIFHEEGGRAR
ncbi:MAG TPA: hypothetical protein VJ385_09825 [Fibrobacteria bacterium]|nr:hypothetical protein [Fibrobacteria bacterium]